MGIDVKYRYYLLLIFVTTSCFGQVRQSLTLEETAVLAKFFQVLTDESEFGYVFYDKKPVCIHGFYCKDPFLVNTPFHKQSVALREGARIWRQLAKTNSDIILHCCEREDPLIPGYIHVLAINVPLFHQAVNENLSLFQYVLGPATRSLGLLQSLLSNQCGFHSLLKNDKVLIGKVLGFGTQNSLYVSRLENIQDAVENDVPPFGHCGKLVQQYEHEYLPLMPSFGFNSINEELNDFEAKITLSSDKLIQKNPEFIFGWLKDSKEEQNFVSTLENTQTKIQKLISSPQFLKTILQKLTGKTLLLDNVSKYKFPTEKEELNKIIAKGIWESLQDFDLEYLSFFIDGFEKLNSPSCRIDRRAWFPSYLRDLIEGKKNLEAANGFFEKLGELDYYQCIVPDKLYYKTIKNGDEESECNSAFVSLAYSIFSPEGQCLVHQDNASINLKNVISGFANGIKGMNIGETREIFIHPSIAYGFDTSLEKCIYLRAVVTLLAINECREPIPSVDQIDLSFLTDNNTLIERETNYQLALQEKGKEVAQHLKKCDSLDLSIVKKYLMEFYTNKESPITSQVEQDLINQVHWNIYFGYR